MEVVVLFALCISKPKLYQMNNSTHTRQQCVGSPPHIIALCGAPLQRVAAFATRVINGQKAQRIANYSTRRQGVWFETHPRYLYIHTSVRL